jgi:hypothetical protein
MPLCRSKRSCLALLAAGSLVLLAGSASATPITYDLTVDVLSRAALGVDGEFTGSFTADTNQQYPSFFSLSVGGETWECVGSTECAGVGRYGLSLSWIGGNPAALYVARFRSEGDVGDVRLKLAGTLDGSINNPNTTGNSDLTYSFSERVSAPASTPEGTHTPEPSAALLFGVGAATFGVAVRRRQR